MKLTEAQLKRIIAEEVQIAIEEGLLDKVYGAAKGVGGYVSGKAAGALSSAGSKIAGAAKAGLGAAQQAYSDTVAAAKAGSAEAEKASVQRQQRATIEQASALVNNLGRIFDKIGSAEGGKQQIMDMINTLATNANIDLGELAKSVTSSRAAGKEQLANAPRAARGPEGAGQVTSRIGNITAGTSGINEEKADAITEAILKRIMKKR